MSRYSVEGDALGFVASLILVLSTIASAENVNDQRLAATSSASAPRIVLVGDSTMATRTGYGDALCKLFQANVECINLARGGRSSKSFRAEGMWNSVQRMLAETTSSDRPRFTYVLIQFGHNDQPGKPERSTDLKAEFPNNIARYVEEVKVNNGKPVLVTPLTRRIFKEGVLQNDLRPWAEAVMSIARDKSVPMIDLNAKSYAAVAAMGAFGADSLAEEPAPVAPLLAGGKSRFDYTHLGEKGAALFAGMVATELVEQVPSLAAYLRR